ncbi:MAG: hypothetical protein K1X95_15645 [Acidimicrobiia bacterium]|nr:hypothetical protein [Acidimicrobiia bacterium]
MTPARILRRVAIAIAAAVVGATVVTLLRARGAAAPPPDGTGWHQVS